MASVTKQDIPNEANMMSELWVLIKEYYIPEDSNAYWEALVNKCDQIYKSCPTRLTYHLLRGVLDYLEEEHKKRNGKE